MILVHLTACPYHAMPAMLAEGDLLPDASRCHCAAAPLMIAFCKPNVTRAYAITPASVYAFKKFCCYSPFSSRRSFFYASAYEDARESISMIRYYAVPPLKRHARHPRVFARIDSHACDPHAIGAPQRTANRSGRSIVSIIIQPSHCRR